MAIAARTRFNARDMVLKPAPAAALAAAILPTALGVILAAGITTFPAAPQARAGTPACDTPPYRDVPEVAVVVAALAPALDRFPRLASTLDNDIAEICVSDGMVGAHGWFEPDTGRVTLARGLAPGAAQAVLVHELRHVQQHVTGACAPPDLAMKEHARVVMAMEADASVTALVVAAALRDAGEPAMWHALLAWPLQADLVRTFDAELEAGSDLAGAASRAFAAWYDNGERRQAYYVSACLDYLDRSERLHLLDRNGILPDAFFAQLCRLPDGRSYDCAGVH